MRSPTGYGSELEAKGEVDLPVAPQLRAVEVLVERRAHLESELRAFEANVAAADDGAREQADLLSAIEHRIGGLAEAPDHRVVSLDRALLRAVQAQGGLQAGRPGIAAPEVDLVIIAPAIALGIVVERQPAAVAGAQDQRFSTPE